MDEVLLNQLKKYTNSELNVLCDKLRSEIYTIVNVCGGHLSSNLGAVEATVALCYVFNFPKDKVIFDVGHQCYAYKLLTGRNDRFTTLRKKGGLSGFPKREESVYDCYDTGHAGTALSAALGMAKARDIKGEDYHVIAFIGDGSFNNGLVYEALNSLKILRTKILIILNDNGMSIAPTVGGMHEILENIRLGERAESKKDDCEKRIAGIKLLENFGLTYMGVKNGNDAEEMVEAMTQAKELLKSQSVLLHISTKKGKGYDFCEEHPTNTHGIPPVGSAQEKEYSKTLGETLTTIAKKNKNIAVITAAMTNSLGLSEFFREYPERAFDVGICEENACVLCSSMATAGIKPYYAIYSTFLQRAFDEIIVDVCLQDLPVVFCVDRAGIVGADGETHQGVFDLSYLTFIPNLTIATPKDTEEFKRMIEFSENYPHPLAIRYPRNGKVLFKGSKKKIEVGKWEYLNRAKSNITVIAAGERCLIVAMKILQKLTPKNKAFNLINARFIKPIDTEMLENLPEGKVITIEDNVKIGGLGEKVSEFLRDYSQKTDKKFTISNFAYRDEFIKQGEIAELQKEYGVNCEEIEKCILDDNCLKNQARGQNESR